MPPPESFPLRNLKHVDPRRTRGLFSRAYATFSATRLGRFLSAKFAWKADPYLLRLTRGRFGSGLVLPTALLETRGAKTGALRRNAVIYFHDGDRVTIIASKAGAPHHPAWFHNLRIHPDVTFGGIPMRASVVADEAERKRLWALADRVFAPYATYRRDAAKANRTIPIIQLTAREPSATRNRLGPATVGKTTGMETAEANAARPPIVSQTEWDAALAALLERERNVAAAMHELAAARKRMPMVRVEHDYAFEGPDGRRSLPELFDGRRQLILYRFFFEEGDDAGCVGCSSVADGIPELGLLHARDITFAMASSAPQANLRRYAERMGWTDVPWYTIRSERFSADFGVDEWFGFNVFLRDGNDVYRTYFLQHGAMVQWIGSLWSLWSLTPYGGQSDDEDLPEGWPRAPGSFWFRRHDEFDEPPPSARLAIDANDRA